MERPRLVENWQRSYQIISLVIYSNKHHHLLVNIIMGSLRIFFAMSVLLGHIQINYLISPIYAVQGFYIISGFYMSLILNEKYISSDNNLLFYKKRFMRLLPTYWLIAAFSIIIAVLFYYKGESNILFFDFHNFPDNAGLTTWIYIFITNIIVWGQDLALFMGISPETGNIFLSTSSFAEDYPMLRYMAIPVAWSVSSEFTFYLIAPYILRNRRKLVFSLFLLSAISNILTNFWGLNDSNWRFRFFPSILMYFLSGYYAYKLYSKISTHKPPTKYKYACIISSISALTIILHLNIPYAIHSISLLCICTTTIPYLFYSFKKDTNDRAFGEMSYPLYLIHPVFIGINELLGINSHCFVIIFSLVAAYCCYRFFIIRMEIIRSHIQ